MVVLVAVGAEKVSIRSLRNVEAAVEVVASVVVLWEVCLGVTPQAACPRVRLEQKDTRHVEMRLVALQ